MKKVVAFLMVLATTGLVACGGSDNHESTGSPRTPHSPYSVVKIEAAPSGALTCHPNAISTTSGKTVVFFRNPLSAPRRIVIVDPKLNQAIGSTGAIKKAGSSVAFENLKPGTYPYYCASTSNPRPKAHGTLTVTK